MVGKREIRSQINGVKNTQIITKAMKMVASSKMRKTQTRMIASRPYAYTIRKVIGHMVLGNLEYRHPYMEERSVKAVGYLIVSTDRGLCGGLNTTLFRECLKSIDSWAEQDVGVSLALVGTKAINFFAPMQNIPIVAQVSGMGDNPTLADIIGLVKVLLKDFRYKKMDRIYLVYNKFINTMSQCVQIDQLLPLAHYSDPDSHIKAGTWDYLYEPAPKELLDTLLSRFIESQVYQSIVESLASEQAARMVSMQSATDNASDLLTELQLTYNKARQATITQELNEIVAGSAAV
jgi:F-type H+-transporting ATPase subunit gamma